VGLREFGQPTRRRVDPVSRKHAAGSTRDADVQRLVLEAKYDAGFAFDGNEPPRAEAIRRLVRLGLQANHQQAAE
jgi:hypothetical protein